MRNVVIQESLSDKFLVAFKEQVMRNDRYTIPENAVNYMVFCIVLDKLEYNIMFLEYISKFNML